MKSQIFFFFLIVCTFAKYKQFIDSATTQGKFQMYERDQCYFTSKYPGYQSMQAIWDDDYDTATLVLYTDDDCSEGRHERSFDKHFRLRDARKKRMGYLSVTDDSKCSHKKHCDGEYFVDHCFVPYEIYEDYEELIRDLRPRQYDYDWWDDWFVLKKFNDDNCTDLYSEERIFPCNKCFNNKYGVCGASYTVILTILLILAFLF